MSDDVVRLALQHITLRVSPEEAQYRCKHVEVVGESRRGAVLSACDLDGFPVAAHDLVWR